MEREHRGIRRLLVGTGVALTTCAAALGCGEGPLGEDVLDTFDLLLVNEQGASDISVSVSIENYFSRTTTLDANPISDRDGFVYHGFFILQESTADNIMAGHKVRITASQGMTTGQETVCTLTADAVEDGDAWAKVNGTAVECFFHTVECTDSAC